MSREELGFALVAGTLVVAALIAYLLAHVFEVEWFKERLLSDDRWTRASGMLPIAVPLYIVLGLIFSAIKSSS